MKELKTGAEKKIVVKFKTVSIFFIDFIFKKAVFGGFFTFFFMKIYFVLILLLLLSIHSS
ncbi:MAG: hypothetical protein LBS07_06310 [Prevotellaceae bacterium]|jgi:hypothetical protein|nr:hypothetical protein [Prevotellaceae bacterium]